VECGLWSVDCGVWRVGRLRGVFHLCGAYGVTTGRDEVRVGCSNSHHGPGAWRKTPLRAHYKPVFLENSPFVVPP
jgi:hypothetical protein